VPSRARTATGHSTSKVKARPIPLPAGLEDLLGQEDNQFSALAAAGPLAALERSGTSAGAWRGQLPAQIAEATVHDHMVAVTSDDQQS
jgi:hypothetical protein